MTTEPNADLEKLIHQELQKLPELTAPATLIPGVLAAIQQRAAAPWWRRAWWDWPAPAKALFALLALATAGLATGGFWWLGSGATPLAGPITERLNSIGSLWDALAPLSEAGGLLWQKAGYPLAIGALVLSMSFYLFCLGLGTVFVRVAVKRS
jgi:hypothetical protein